MRKPYRFYSLARPKLRQSWNKYNLYNLSRNVGREPQIRGGPTFFQQKWAAKSKARAYHGEHVPEKKWVRLFSRRLLSAVDMPPEYLAANDGSEQAGGRGSGLGSNAVTAESYSKIKPPPPPELRFGRFGDINKVMSAPFHKMTPYMQMTFAPLERRLDTAVFRALFASSVRQARQFIIHGAVKVNGKKLVHPSYQLNPGDMFQVDVEKVMYGTGMQKAANSDKRLRENLDARKKSAEAFQKSFLTKGATEESAESPAEGEAAAKDEAESKEEPEGEVQAAEATETAEAPGLESLSEEERWKMTNRQLRFMLKSVKKLMKEAPKDFTAREKKQLRLFRDDVKRFLSHPESSKVSAKELMTELELQMKSHEMMREKFGQMSVKEDAAAATTTEEGTSAEGGEKLNREREIGKGLDGLSEEQMARAREIMGDSQLSREEMRRLSSILQADERNPVDESKPYATPWRPRPYMSAFAFIPKYLEVNQNACAAVYLRHPVARKGSAEVPTPFSYLTSQLAHNWYLQRG